MAHVTMKGNPVELTGHEVKPGEAAPDFTAVGPDLAEAKFSKMKDDKIRVLVAVPSLDTSVCSLESKRFDKEAAALSDEAEFIVISMDLPFAQKRWAESVEAKHLKLLSDHREAEFAQKYGVLMKGLRLLARAVFVVDQQGKVAYTQLVPEVSKEPNYSEVLDAVKKLI